MGQSIILLKPSSPVASYLADNLENSIVDSISQCEDQLKSGDYKAVVIDLTGSVVPDFEWCQSFVTNKSNSDIPIVLLSPSSELQYKLKAFEYGFDDYLGPDISAEEALARVSKSIFNAIANGQLKSSLEQAHQTAYTVMTDNSDLGANLRFLLEVNSCENLDELGMLLFSTLSRYGLSCSLQMRSLYGIKNMEANGMAKDLESQLLLQMKDAGRYIDFGCRTISNYGQASILIRNMPMEDEARYGAIKDNTFILIQGVDSRIKALDRQQQLVEERQSLHKLSKDVREVMSSIDQSYQDVMRNIVNAVEDMADSIMDKIPTLALSLEQEEFFESVSYRCVVSANKVFNDGLKVDECFQQLSDDMSMAISRFERIEIEAVNQSADNLPNEQNQSSGEGVDLF